MGIKKRTIKHNTTPPVNGNTPLRVWPIIQTSSVISGTDVDPVSVLVLDLFVEHVDVLRLVVDRVSQIQITTRDSQLPKLVEAP